MSRVVITIEERELSGGVHLEITLQSTPPIPVCRITDPRHLAELVGDQDLDIDRATKAQVAARLAVGEIVGHAEAGLIMVAATKPEL